MADPAEEVTALAVVNTLRRRLTDLEAALRPALAAAEATGRGGRDGEAARLHASVAHAAVVAASVLLQTQPPNELLIRGDTVRLRATHAVGCVVSLHSHVARLTGTGQPLPGQSGQDDGRPAHAT